MSPDDMIEELLTRRSVKVKQLVEPGPDEEALKQILTVAMRVPDHGKLAPWRVKLLDKSAQATLGDVCAQRFLAANPDANEKQVAFERDRPQRAPLLIAVLYTPTIGRIPVWEQQLSTGAVCMNLLHAANALGYAGQWLTEWIAYDKAVTQALGGGEDDKIAGLIYLGTAEEKPEDRERPDWDAIVEYWKG